MFMNLHTLPAGQHMFTLYLTLDPKGTPQSELCSEEIDLVAPKGSSVADLLAAAKGELADYPAETRVFGIVDQSDDFVVFTDI